MRYAVTVARGGFLERRWTVMTRLQRLCSNTTAATGTGVVGVFQTPEMKSSTTTKLEKINFLQQQNVQERSEQRATMLSRNGSVKIKKTQEALPKQAPVLGFNCGRYDLNLIKEHFVELLADTTAEVQVGKKANTTMFMKTNGFRVVDIIKYLGRGTSYDKWVKAYGCSVQKSWLPYEWFDSPEKLNYPGLPDYPEWYSRLKGKYVLSLSEYRVQKNLQREGDANVQRLVVLLQRH